MLFWKGITNSVVLHRKWPDSARCLHLWLAIFPIFCLQANAAVFTQETYSPDDVDGSSNQVILNPNALARMRTIPFELGFGRRLEIHTNLPPERHIELNEVAAVVQDCYRFLEQETGRALDGGVLLYLLQFPQRPRYYKFTVDVPDSLRWNEVRVALLDEGQPLLGRRASPHVTELLYDTLPHELTHSLLVDQPTVRHDLDGETGCGTRWFIEGVCEKMAKDFGRASPARSWQRSYPAEVQSRIWTWGQESGLPPELETRCYELSRWLVSAWCQEIELSRLLDIMSSTGGDYDGKMLGDLLAQSTGWKENGLLYQAHRLYRRSLTPLKMSELH